MSYRRVMGAPFSNAPSQHSRAPTTLLAATLLIAITPLFATTARAQFTAQPTFGSGDDHHTLTNDNFPVNSRSLQIDGGAGNDRLTLRGIALESPGRLMNWETLELEQGTRLTLDDSLVLGDTDNLPGRMVIDANSAALLPHYSAAILPSGSQSLNLINHGTIDLRGLTANRLLVEGNYSGSGTIFMDLVAGDDDSLSDRLIISGGHADGSTRLAFNRLAGGGADTIDGILVVETRSGGTTGTGAFYMPEPVSAGPYDYFLFRGANEPDEADNWYLRSNLRPGDVPATVPAPEVRPFSNISDLTGVVAAEGIFVSEDATMANTAAQTAPAPALLVAAAPPIGSDPIPIYRPEIPLYAQAKSLARLTSLQEIGSYHKRRGEQRSWFDGINQDWLRVHHTSADYNWRGDISNRFDGNISGFQLGTNLWSGPTCTGGAREMGLYFGTTRASGDVTGFARGFSDYAAGENQLTSTHIGYYFNNYRPDMGYLDVTAKVAYLELESRSHRGIGDTIYGPQLTVSIEQGFTWQVSEQINLEPQAQVIVNYSNLSAFQDSISAIEPDMTPEASFRLGLRGYNVDSNLAGHLLRFYLFGNVWHTLGGNDELLFDLKLKTGLERQSTWGEAGGGVVLLEHQFGSAFVNVGYQHSLDDLNWSGGSASLGFNWAW